MEISFYYLHSVGLRKKYIQKEIDEWIKLKKQVESIEKTKGNKNQKWMKKRKKTIKTKRE